MCVPLALPIHQAKISKFEEVMARLQAAFSPQQIARLILWVSANRAHISKLPLLPTFRGNVVDHAQSSSQHATVSATTNTQEAIVM